MQNIGQRNFVEINGLKKTFELPPLLLSRGTSIGEKTFRSAKTLVELELFSNPLTAKEADLEEAKECMAIALVEKYRIFRNTWSLGNSVIKWIWECEEVFKYNPILQNVLNHDVWPHAGQHSFVSLLEDKAIPFNGYDVRAGVGLRMLYPKPLPIDFLTTYSLIMRQMEIGESNYDHWANSTPKPVSSLPPEKFHFDTLII
jgi:hypothetical protein